MEIQYNDPVIDYKSNEKAKWFFDNMTEYLDSLLGIQEEVAHRITVEVDEVLAEVVSKVRCAVVPGIYLYMTHISEKCAFSHARTVKNQISIHMVMLNLSV